MCDNYLFSKSDGSLKCGSFLDHGLTIYEASAQCAKINAIIPELPYQNDNQIINLLKVCSIFFEISKINICFKIILARSKYPIFGNTLSDTTEPILIFKHTAGPGPTNIIKPYRYLWIGLSDAAVDGNYIWNTTGQKPGYTYWLDGQPSGTLDENAVALDWPEHGRWLDTQATHTDVASLCEQSLTTVLPGTFLMGLY